MSKPNQSVLNLRYLYDRPCQPVFREKGLNGDVTFDIPADYFADRYKQIANDVSTRFSPGEGTVIKVTKLSTLPSITAVAALDKRANFNIFNPYHQELASQLMDVFMKAKNVDELLSCAVYAQQRVNPYLFIYSLSVSMMHRPDTANFTPPSHAVSFPELYISTAALNDARKTTNVPSGSREPIDVTRDWTAIKGNPETRVAYFREDIGVNLHHWHWHLVYPNKAPAEIIKKDRRGELFYYMHQQLVARYNFERLSNSLARAKPIRNFEELIPEGYFPKLDTVIASRTWAARQGSSSLSDVSRKDQEIAFTIQQMEQWRDRINEAIERGSVNKGSGSDFLQLKEEDGIDILGDLIEASTLSVNQGFYGNYHNNGHTMLAFVHDPDYRFQEGPGVMGNLATAMRDPVFYRWHTHINDLFNAYKMTLTPYTKEQLEFKNVKVEKLTVKTENVKKDNVLVSHWEKDEFELSRGLDFARRGSLRARFTHLQHRPFTYNLTIQNNAGRNRVGTVRIFLAPKHDERKDYDMDFSELRMLFIEMDRFTTNLKTGTNEVTRTSAQSSVTIPFNVTFRDLDQVPEANDEAGATAASRSNFVFCGCGWPDHMLVPKGTADGMDGVLVAMVTDFDTDKVDNLSMDANQTQCDNAFSFCGVRNSRYPDKKAMGFPFDRTARSGVTTLKDFLTDNMLSQDVSIYHLNREYQGQTLRSNTTTTANTTITANTTTTTTTTTTVKTGKAAKT